MSRSDVEKSPERWETNKVKSGYAHKIVEIGNTKYRVLTLPPSADRVYQSDHDFFYDDIMRKVECPTELGAFYE